MFCGRTKTFLTVGEPLKKGSSAKGSSVTGKIGTVILLSDGLEADEVMEAWARRCSKKESDTGAELESVS